MSEGSCSDVPLKDHIRCQPALIGDRVDDMAPKATVRPTSVGELAEVLRDQPDASIVARGGGSKLDLGFPPSRLDLIFDSRGLDKILDFKPDDLVVTVQAGIALNELQTVLTSAKRRLSLDPSEKGATLGGIVAANSFGPRRNRFGSARDMLLGATFVTGDGRVGHAGSKVVKNVAGYDLPKLFVGSLGTLGLLTELTFRLHPVPQSVGYFGASFDRAHEAMQTVRALRRGHDQPSAIELSASAYHGSMCTISVVAMIEGARPRALNQDSGCLLALEKSPSNFGVRPASGAVEWKICHPTAALERVLDHVVGLSTAFSGPVTINSHAGIGITWIGAASGDLSQVESVTSELRKRIVSLQATAIVTRAPAALKRRIDVWGPVNAIEMMRRVKEQFDPNSRLAPGRFVGRI